MSGLGRRWGRAGRVGLIAKRFKQTFTTRRVTEKLSVDVKLCRAAKIKLLAPPHSSPRPNQGGGGPFCGGFLFFSFLNNHFKSLFKQTEENISTRLEVLFLLLLEFITKTKKKCFLFPHSLTPPAGDIPRTMASIRDYSRNVFNCFLSGGGVLFYGSMPYRSLFCLVFLSRFVFSETIPSEVCYTPT